MNLNEIENLVLNKMLEGDHPSLAVLRDQAIGASVKTREMTGTGFFTEFKLSPNAKPLPALSGKIKIGDVLATAKGLRGGMGFILDINNGFIELLEGYTYDEPWPDQLDEVCLYYENPTRDELFGILEK